MYICTYEHACTHTHTHTHTHTRARTHTHTQTCCGGAKGTGCCMDKPKDEGDGIKTIQGSSVLFDASKFQLLDPTQEPIFPSALKLDSPLKPLAIKGPRVSWYRPLTLEQLLELRSKFPNEDEKGKSQNKLIVGNTEIGE